MADFLAANPREVIVIGLSNINCGDKAAARQELLGALAKSPLLNYLAVQVGGWVWPQAAGGACRESVWCVLTCVLLPIWCVLTCLVTGACLVCADPVC